MIESERRVRDDREIQRASVDREERDHKGRRGISISSSIARREKAAAVMVTMMDLAREVRSKQAAYMPANIWV